MLARPPKQLGLKLRIDQVVAERENFRLSVSDLTFERSEYVALIGGNGAGKSTLIEAVLGLTDSEVCDIIINDVSSVLEMNSLGAQLQTLSWNPEFKVGDIMSLHKASYGRQSDAVVKALGLDDLSKKWISQTSRGERVRIDLFMAFAHEPDIIFLDEPSTGLDAGFVKGLFDLLDSARARGATIISATHDPRELQISDKVIWMEAGKVCSHGALSTLISNELGAWKASLSPKHAENMPKIISSLNKVKGLRVTQQGDSLLAYSSVNISEHIEQISSNIPLKAWGISESNAADVLAMVSDSAKTNQKGASS